MQTNIFMYLYVLFVLFLWKTLNTSMYTESGHEGLIDFHKLNTTDEKTGHSHLPPCASIQSLTPQR